VRVPGFSQAGMGTYPEQCFLVRAEMVDTENGNC